MAILELSSQQFGDQIGVKWAMAKRIIQSRVWKGHALQVIEKKSQKGKPGKFVLWDTELNQPATGETDVNQTPENVIQITHAHPRAPSTTVGEHHESPAAPDPHYPIENADADRVHDSYQSQYAVNVHRLPHAQNLPAAAGAMALPNLVPETQASALQPSENLDVNKEFNRLLHNFLTSNPNKASIKVLRHRYRKIFAKTGEIPPALLEKETRGRKTTLSYDVVGRFVELVQHSVELDKHGNPNVTQSLRKVTNFHYQLEEEFKRSISLTALRQLVKSQNLKRFLTQPDDNKQKEKTPSFFVSTPVMDLIQMDGVQTDYIALGESLDSYRFIDCIEFYDHGSRRLMAIHGYFGESNENSVDIFNKFLAQNEFTKTVMRLRPDNAKGFLNLQRCITEINKHHADPDGFTLIDDYARAGTPTDKAHLEASHKAFHNFEHHMIRKMMELWPESLVGSFKKRKKISDNEYKVITCKVFAITLEQFNQSGILKAYQDYHNGKQHCFTEDGKQRRWIPDDRYHAHLAQHDTFKFSAEDLERNLIYGGTKNTVTVSKEGLITYQQAKYGKFTVEKPELFSRHATTKVKISFVAKDKLALFKEDKDGEFLCFAVALKAPELSEKVVTKLEEKKEKQAAKGSYHSITKQFELINLPINESGLKELISQGLTLEMTAAIIQANDDIRNGDGSEKSNGRRWFYFVGAAKDAINNQNRATGASRNTA